MNLVSLKVQCAAECSLFAQAKQWRFAYSHFAYFRPKSDVSPTRYKKHFQLSNLNIMHTIIYLDISVSREFVHVSLDLYKMFLYLPISVNGFQHSEEGMLQPQAV